MAKYAIFFSYTPDAWNRMILKPNERSDAARQLAESVGGSLESLYFMFGDRDGFAVFDAPDARSAAAVSIAVGSTGAFAHVETRELIAPADMPGVLEKAGAARESYRPPGE